MADPVMDIETIEILLDLLNPLHGSLDRQIMDQLTDERELDAPSDREYNVNVTVRNERDLTQALLILENRKRSQAQNSLDLLRLRDRLNVAGEFLCGLSDDPKAREAYAAVLYVQSSLKLVGEPNG